MQLKAAQDSTLLEPATIMAQHPSTEQPFGLCNFVLVRDPDEDPQLSGIRGKRASLWRTVLGI